MSRSRRWSLRRSSETDSATPYAALDFRPGPGELVADDQQAEVRATDVMADLVSIDAADAELVLHRAIELTDDGVLLAEQFPIASLEQTAAELHIPLRAVADALAEYRAGGLTGSSATKSLAWLDRLVGPAKVQVSHRTGLSEDVTVARLSEWFKRRHHLRIRVNARGAVVGVRRRGVVPVAIRSVRSATGSAGLSGLREVRGAAVAVEEGHTSFCVVADVSEQRTQSMVVGSAVALGGAVAVTTAAVVTAPITMVGVPLMVGAGWMATRLTHRYRLRRITEEVEMTVDEVAVGAVPSTLVREIGARLAPSGRSSARKIDSERS